MCLLFILAAMANQNNAEATYYTSCSPHVDPKSTTLMPCVRILLSASGGIQKQVDQTEHIALRIKISPERSDVCAIQLRMLLDHSNTMIVTNIDT